MERIRDRALELAFRCLKRMEDINYYLENLSWSLRKNRSQDLQIYLL